MKKIYFTTLLAVLFCVLGAQAQSNIYSEPSPLQISSKNVEVYFNATGTPLANMPATTKIYAHTGYAVDGKQSDWINAPAWGTNTDKYLLQYVSPNLWMLYIGDIMDYYGITDPSTNVTSLNFVFRNAGGSTQTKDLFLNVVAEGLQVILSSSQGKLLSQENAYTELSMKCSMTADLELLVDGTTIASGKNVNTLSQYYTFPAPGDYKVIGRATANGETVEEIMTVSYLPDPQAIDYPGGTPKMGPVTNPDGSVTFCLGAIGKEQVVIVGSWNNYQYSASQVMNYQDTSNGRYFWTTIEGLDPTQMYLYWFVIDGGAYIVGDPYARLVLDKNNDQWIDNGTFPNIPAYPSVELEGMNVPVAIYQGNINDYDWQCTDFTLPDRTNLIVYELLFRDFTGTEGQAKGNGTVRQAIEKFDYLKELGVNVIELLPMYEFDGNNSWGYNPNFYFAADKAYGTPDDYKEFIDLCHQNGIAVVLDMVFNQSAGLHPWYQMYPISKNPYYNQTAPHAYSVLNDWNQGVPMVQEQWADVITYWLTEYNFDGFRFDLVKGLGLNESYASNNDAATNAYNASRVAEMKYLNSVIQRVKPGAYCINENLAGAQEENEMAADGELNWANINDAGCQFAMGYSSGSNMNRLYALQDSRLPGSTVSYLESHDEQRLAYKQDQWGVMGVKGNVVTSMQRLGSAAAQMIMTPGSHMIWQFSEMGNAQNTKDNNGGNNTSPKIVNWALLDEPNHYGLYENYCQLISIRKNNPQFFTEEADFKINCGTNNWAFGRTLFSNYNDQILMTFVNPNVAGNPYTFGYNFPIKDNSAYKILSQSYGSNSFFDAVAGTVTVPPNCYVVIGSVSLEDAGVEGIEAEGNVSLNAYGANGEIVVVNAINGATVYSLDGKVIGAVEGSGIVPASAGVYVVKSGKETVKVVVR